MDIWHDSFQATILDIYSWEFSTYSFISVLVYPLSVFLSCSSLKGKNSQIVHNLNLNPNLNFSLNLNLNPNIEKCGGRIYYRSALNAFLNSSWLYACSVGLWELYYYIVIIIDNNDTLIAAHITTGNLLTLQREYPNFTWMTSRRSTSNYRVYLLWEPMLFAETFCAFQSQ